MSDFVPNNRHLREVLIFIFHSKNKQRLKRIESYKKCRDWFRRFKEGDFNVDDRPRERRPKTLEDAELDALLNENPCQMQEELASVITRQFISKRLHALEMIHKQRT